MYFSVVTGGEFSIQFNRVSYNFNLNNRNIYTHMIRSPDGFSISGGNRMYSISVSL